MSRSPLPALSLALLLALAAAGARGAGHCIILQYHHVGTDTPAATSVTPAQLDAHLRLLEEGDYQVTDLARVARALERGEPLPARCVALTVDDAYRSVYTELHPRLRARGWPLTVFVATEPVDRGLAPYLDWDEIRELATAGVRFESHGHSHGHLVRRRPGEREADWLARVREDLRMAARRIEAELGHRPTLFAYPYGEYVPALERLVREAGLVGFGQQSGPASRHARLSALPRFAMAVAYADPEDVALKLRTLPLPVASEDPRSPLLPVGERRPSLHLALEAPIARPEALRCWLAGSPDTRVRWTGATELTVEATADVPVGRSRYNCTAPAGEGRWHWYSHLWLRRHDDGRWYAE